MDPSVEVRVVSKPAGFSPLRIPSFSQRKELSENKGHLCLLLVFNRVEICCVTCYQHDGHPVPLWSGNLWNRASARWPSTSSSGILSSVPKFVFETSKVHDLPRLISRLPACATRFIFPSAVGSFRNQPPNFHQTAALPIFVVEHHSLPFISSATTSSVGRGATSARIVHGDERFPLVSSLVIASQISNVHLARDLPRPISLLPSFAAILNLPAAPDTFQNPPPFLLNIVALLLLVVET